RRFRTMISTRPPRYHGEDTQLVPGDVINIDRGSGLVTFLRNGERLVLNAYPLDPELPTDGIRLVPSLTVVHAAGIAKIIGVASGFKLKCDMEDGGTSRFILLASAHG
ncbi:MAG: hypothetical protein WA001_04320, partial [Patescibacteria group bacterium]